MNIKKFSEKMEKLNERDLKNKIKMAMRAYTFKDEKLFRRDPTFFNMKLYY